LRLDDVRRRTTRGSEIPIYVLFGIPVAAVLLGLVLAGPPGWFAAAALVLAGMPVRSLLESSAERTPSRTNCPACGAPGETGRETRSYCGEPF
jgi:hypothetical protein